MNLLTTAPSFATREKTRQRAHLILKPWKRGGLEDFSRESHGVAFKYCHLAGERPRRVLGMRASACTKLTYLRKV